MKRSFRVFILFALAGGVALSFTLPSLKKPFVVAYVFGSKPIDPTLIDPADLTHINYAFAEIVNNEVVPSEDNLFDATNIPALQTLKQANPNLRILISIGGWGGSGGFSDAALTAESRAAFTSSALRYMLRYGFDGIDIDWEYPGQTGAGNTHRPEDKAHFTLMLKDLREGLDSLARTNGHPGYLLTIAAGAGQRFLDFTEMDKAQHYLDFINIMTYDFTGSWSRTTGHHTNLYRSTRGRGSSMDAAGAVELLTRGGVPLEKLVIGAAFYGRGWRMESQEARGLNQEGLSFYHDFGYHTIRDSLIAGAGYKRYWDKAAKASYLFHPDSLIFITYEDGKSIRHKMRYVRRNKLQGIMFWEYFGDSGQELVKKINGK
jgi:chitinase